MADNIDNKMVSEAQVERLLNKIDQERELSEREMESFRKIVDQSISTVRDTVNQLTGKLDKYADLQHETSQQIVELLTQFRSDKENNQTIFLNIVKTQEEIAARVTNQGNRIHNLEMQQAETKSGLTKIDKLEDMVKVNSDSIHQIQELPELRQKVSEIQKHIDKQIGESDHKNKWFNWWSRNWWKILGLSVPVAYGLVSIAEQIKDKFGA